MRLENPVFRDHLPATLKVLLIGGTSHVGKSTLARYLADGLGWEHRATDKLAKHPGRPWRNDGGEVPAHVRAHYAALSADELVEEVLEHYGKNVFPQVDDMVRTCASNPSAKGLVLEGSAVWPGCVNPLISDRIGVVWLIGSEELLVKRIHAESGYDKKPPQDRLWIDAFLKRTIKFAARLEKVVREQPLPAVELRETESVEMLAGRCLQALAARHGGPAAA